MTRSTRLVEVLASMSLACDAADGFPPEATMRSAALAGLLARAVGDDELVGACVLGGLIRHIGCTGFAVEEARTYGAGDDVALRRVMAAVDFGQIDRAVATIGSELAADAAEDDRRRAVEAVLGSGGAAGAAHDRAQCDAAEHLADLLPVGEEARRVASEAFERWDGHGGPGGLAGEDISLVTRVVEVAYVAELFRTRQGRGGAAAELRLRAGGQLDPQLVEAFLALGPEPFDIVEDPARPVWALLLDLEPAPGARLTEGQLDAVALAFARFADLKSPFFAGHSEAVADLAVAAAPALGIEGEDLVALRRAALLHDLGRVGVATGLWERPRALAGPERDRVRYHSWETHRMLASTPLLAPLADIAGAAHERVDGGGYHRGLEASALAAPAAVLAAADVAVALGEDRPHRHAHPPGEAARLLTEEIATGHLRADAVGAVLEVWGAPPPPAPSPPAGLTDREVEVVRLVAAGASNKDVARALGISPRTVAHHVAHVYDKTGSRSRAGLALFAVEHGLRPRTAP